MDSDRFRPQLEEIEGRFTPAPLTPELVFSAAGTAAFYYTGTRAALLDQTFIGVAANRAPTQALAATISAQAADLTDVLSRYVVELQAEQAAHPQFAEWYNQQIERYMTLANEARLSGIQARAVSARIDALNAADAARATTGGTGTGTGLNGTGTGLNGIGTGTATNNTLPTTGTGPGTVGGTTTGPGTTTGGTGTTTGGTTGTGTTTGTTGTGGTGTTTSTPGTTTTSTPGTTTTF